MTDTTRGAGETAEQRTGAAPGTASTTAVYSRADGPPGRTPMRWPHPDATSILLVLLWVVGLLVSTVIPFLIVPPQSEDPDPGRVGVAFAVTMLGVGIFVGAGLLLWRHLRLQAVLVFALVPAVSVVAGGVILTATLLAV